MPINDPVHVDARGMKCPWPALRAARAMRGVDAVTIEADDPIAPGELEALARQQGWTFTTRGPHLFAFGRPVDKPA
ncbi:sulfurtransferase TusA family protein [Sphingobium estronivorans]|uniref:sulfurtransferase TusA family protein n=1 Tax=Sphingobium estronivorans TaxID=1577690 RepID=UPI00123C0627|nr:sulfurtransferase TusA family protein [Sphingobium estronivorans]